MNPTGLGCVLVPNQHCGIGGDELDPNTDHGKTPGELQCLRS
jgi:hypothetical protein